MVFSLTATTQIFQEGTDRTSISTNHLACTWREKMKGEESIKGEIGNERGGGGEQKGKNIATIKNCICNQFQRNI